MGVDFDVWALQERTVFPSQAEQLHEDVLLFYLISATQTFGFPCPEFGLPPIAFCS